MAPVAQLELDVIDAEWWLVQDQAPVVNSESDLDMTAVRRPVEPDGYAAERQLEQNGVPAQYFDPEIGVLVVGYQV